ncbi:MAG: hypothetical protein FJY29_10235 [Betaproteobacteria bacterium]|nr:hypothetical protein [Betaproteobacteria bacterium]
MSVVRLSVAIGAGMLLALGVSLSACKPRDFNSNAGVQGLTQLQFDQQFEVTHLTSCKQPNGEPGGDLRIVWRVRNSAGSAVTPYVLGFAGDAITTKGAKVRFQIMTAIDAPRPLTPTDTPVPFSMGGYAGYELQIPADEAQANWGYVEVDGKKLSFADIDAGVLLLPSRSPDAASAPYSYFVTANRLSYAFKCDPLDAQAQARLRTFAVRDGSHGFKGDRGVVVKPSTTAEAPSADGRFVTQWSCAGNRRKAINHNRQPLPGGWLNQEEYCEWDRNGTPPAFVTQTSTKPAQLKCMVRTSFDQNRTYFLQQRLYKATVEQQRSEGFANLGDFKSSYYDTKFNGYAFLVGGREGYHVWDSRVWKKMGEKGDPRGAYISDTRKGIIGHCMQYTCMQADEIGYTGNCVAGRQSDPLICSVINSIYCISGAGQNGCKQTTELNLTKRPALHADANHVTNSAALDPVINPTLMLPPGPLNALSPAPTFREDVLFRSDYAPPTRLGDTGIKLDLVIPETLPECKWVVDPTLLNTGRVTDPAKFLANDKTLVQCSFAKNTRYNNCDEVASQLQVRIVFDTQPKR